MIYPKEMNHRQHFQEILDFLKPYQKIWQNEIMLMYPNELDGYPTEWLEELASIRDKHQVIELEKKNVKDFIKSPTLLSFYQRIEELCRFPEIAAYPEMATDKYTFLYIIPKKQHEIRKLAPYVNAFYQDQKIESLIDIGGGIGLLAQTLNNQFGLKVKTLDMDPALQKTGRERHEKNAKDPQNKVQYVQVKVSENSPELINHLNPKTLTIGLHTCGGLAVEQIRSSVKYHSPLINFGCCYLKMDGLPETQNISAFAQQHEDKFEFTLFALTLASRAHRKMNEKDYDYKQKVKFFRYALHILLHDHYGITELVSFGNSVPALYEGSFSNYVRDQFKRVNLELKHTDTELNTFFEKSELQERIWKMLAAQLIRNALGRLLEAYILLDRALYLEEHGYQVKLQEFFNEELSPRNIGITATR